MISNLHVVVRNNWNKKHPNDLDLHVVVRNNWNKKHSNDL